jgi:hypothetical protein
MFAMNLRSEFVVGAISNQFWVKYDPAKAMPSLIQKGLSNIPMRCLPLGVITTATASRDSLECSKPYPSTKTSITR